MPVMFENIKNIYFSGIGGIGMSGLANYLLEKGYNVSGSDAIQTAITERLSAKGAKINYEQNGNDITKETDLIIYTAAVKEDNPEYSKGKELGIKMVKRAEALGNIVNKDKLLAVSGTHGKTTTTSMTAKIFIDADADPTVFVGGSLDFLNEAASRAGNKGISIVEADEYDRSFHTLRSDVIIITNIEEDHLDIYKDIEDIKESFKKFISVSKPDCTIIACGDDENIREVLEAAKDKKKILYGFGNGNDEKITDVKTSEKRTSFNLNSEHIELSAKGRHNILNSSAAFIAAKLCGLDMNIAKKSLKEFKGVSRRLELKYSNSVTVYDDYAHHPTEVRATLEAIKSSGNSRIITIFQPHLFSRTRDFYKDFANALSDTDVLILSKIYPAREKEIAGITSELISKEMSKDIETYYKEEKSEIFAELNRIKKEGDVLIFMGAGSITDQCKEYVEILKSHEV